MDLFFVAVGKMERDERPKVRRKPDMNGLFDDKIFVREFCANIQGAGFISRNGAGTYEAKYKEIAELTLVQLREKIGKRRAKRCYRNWVRNCSELMEK